MSHATLQSRAGRRPFTLIELILVMVLMLTLVAMSAPRLAGFAKNRLVLEEGRRLAAASRWAGSEAAAQGIYMQLTLEPQNGRFTVDAAPGWTLRDHAPLQRVFDPAVELILPEMEKGTEAPALVFHPDGTVEGDIPATLLLRNRFDSRCEAVLSWTAGISAYRFADTTTEAVR